MKPDLISIVVPVYNVEKYVAICIDSIIKQTYDNLEIILVDDGSTDNSSSICNRFEEKYNNIKCIHKDNQGLGLARNTGIENSQGKYIAFVDGDDYIGENHILNLYSKLKQYGTDICMGGYTKDIDGELTRYENVLVGSILSGDMIIQTIIPLMCGKLKPGDNIQMSSCMSLYSKKIIDKNEIRFPSEREFISEDFVFNIKFLSKSDNVCFSDNTEYYYRFNRESLTRTYREDRFEKQKKLFSFIENTTKEYGVYEKSKQRNLSTFIGWVRGCIRMEQANYKSIGFRKAYGRIKSICEDALVQEAFSEFDDSKINVTSRLNDAIIKRKKYLLIWVVMMIKNHFGV